MSVYALPPGQAICPYHYENPEEEWLLVLDGRPTLRHPGGEDELQPWDVVGTDRAGLLSGVSSSNSQPRSVASLRAAVTVIQSRLRFRHLIHLSGQARARRAMTK